MKTITETVQTQDYIIDNVILDNLKFYMRSITRKAKSLDALMSKGVLGGQDAYAIGGE